MNWVRWGLERLCPAPHETSLEFPACLTCGRLLNITQVIRKSCQVETHQQVDKASGEVNHMERWNCTLRQWLGWVTCKTLAFSKVDNMHHFVSCWFIVEYNLHIQQSSV